MSRHGLDAVVSLFSGAGGLSTGFHAAGLPSILAADRDMHAGRTYCMNLSPDTFMLADLGRDAQVVVDVCRARLGVVPLFAVIGGPPCQGFSSAGHKSANDPRNALVLSYMSIVNDLRPSWFLFENVEGMLTSGRGDSVCALVAGFIAAGYTLRVERVAMAGYGLPQARKRVLLVGNRHGLSFRLPASTHAFTSLRGGSMHGIPATGALEAISGLPWEASRLQSAPVPSWNLPGEPQEGSWAACMGASAISFTNQHVSRQSPSDNLRVAKLLPGQSMRDLPEHMWPAGWSRRAFRRVSDGTPSDRRGGAPSVLRRLVSDDASPTITGSSSSELVHPMHNRTLTLRECARLQGFPDSYQFSGGRAAVAQQIGNAFPPSIASMLAECLLNWHGLAGGGRAVHATGLQGVRLGERKAASPALKFVMDRLSGFL